MKMRNLLLMSLFVVCLQLSAQQTTYCNPINLDYPYAPYKNDLKFGKHRATADPLIKMFKGDYYLFSTNAQGYWWSDDLNDWKFIPKNFLKPYHTGKGLNAPAVWVQDEAMYVFGSTYTSDFPIWKSTDPKANKWTEAKDSLAIGGWDPDVLVDDDGRIYMYTGSSNRFPIEGVELDPKTFDPIGARKPLLLLDDDRFGWQRFGEYLDNTFIDPFIEGATVTRHDGKYYFQYAGPGTEFSGYADGVVVGDSPLEIPTHPQSMPFSYKPGGFARGAGHGGTFQDEWDNWWHVSTMSVSTKNPFERRIGMWPAGFDDDGVMYMDAAFGDYPTYLPTGEEDHLQSRFTGWMLLNYNKPVQVSSTLGGYNANNAVDENIKTYWSAETADRGEFMQTDLGELSTVRAIQINYADQDAEFIGKSEGVYHQYQIFSSTDGKNWKLLIDKSRNKKDVPHDYVELQKPVKTRFLKLVNITMPTGKFAISGFRVFGKGNGKKPKKVEGFVVLRTEKDKRSAWIKWGRSDDAYAYNIYVGTDPDKLYNSIMVYNKNEYYFKAMDKEVPYYFTIEAINENGVSERTEIIKAE